MLYFQITPDTMSREKVRFDEEAFDAVGLSDTDDSALTLH